MKQEVPQLIKNGQCKECEGCCRFSHKKNVWTPKLSQEESASNCLKELDTVEFEGQFKCRFLSANNLCQVYNDRPFECMLYPFILTIKNNKVFVSAHLSCPYILDKRYSKEFSGYIKELNDYFKKETTLSFLRNNPQLIADYSSYQSEIEELFQIGL